MGEPIDNLMVGIVTIFMERVMRLLAVCLFAVLSFFSMNLVAETADEQSSGSSEQVDRAAIEDLIGTLESETERQAFIDKLQLMLNTEPEPEPELTSVFGLDGTGSGVLSEFTALTESYGLPENLIGDVLAFGVTTLLVMVGIFLNGFLSRFLNNRLTRLRQRLNWDKERFSSVFMIQRIAGYAVGLILVGYAALDVAAVYFGEESMTGLGSLLGTVLSISLAAVVFAGIWEGVNALLESLMSRHERLNSSRFQTITPIIRNILLITLSLLSVMVVLSEVGINIMPLLAGAGVLGIAVGFGAQTLVKDFLTGLTVVFEDLLQIGDVVKINDHFGLVEKITLRKIQMRDLDGTVHTIPFGEVSIISNLTKDYSYYLMDVGVAYRENTDDVVAVMREVDEDLRADEKYKELILEPLEVMGVDQFADSAVMIKARIKTKPIQQWNVGREYNRRLKIAFDARNIEIPFPHQTIYFGEDKQGKAPNANVRLVEEAEKRASAEEPDA
ncbi:mechanosensitive ion channel family protein [Thalassolituus sp.]|uniref:mechanosensitive ion channel family protein n=1 Tax=Thalassolituus sp. TaxID=2030822 RepID=UPI0035193FCE